MGFCTIIHSISSNTSILVGATRNQTTLKHIEMGQIPIATNDPLPEADPFRRLPNGRLRDEYYKPYPPNNFAPKPGHQKLDIAIIGAGIAGLLAAVALVQSGHNVEVISIFSTSCRAMSLTSGCEKLYERSKFANEIGAAINMCPNAARILSYYEFNFPRAMPTTVEEVSHACCVSPLAAMSDCISCSLTSRMVIPLNFCTVRTHRTWWLSSVPPGYYFIESTYTMS